MAGNQTSPFQAEQATRVNKNRKAAADANKSNAGISRMPAQNRQVKNPKIRGGIRGGVICLCLFILFCGMAMNPEGKILQWMRDGLLGLFGKGVFYISIFALAFLTFLHFGKNRKTLSRRVKATVFFVLLYGVLQHLLVNDILLGEFTDPLLSTLWIQGVAGSSGGVFCGIIGVLLRYLVGKWIAILLVFVLWLLALLGAMNISLLRLIDTIRNDDGSKADAGPDATDQLAQFIIGVRERSRARREARRAARAQARSDDEEEPDHDDDDQDDDDDDVAWENPMARFFGRKTEKKPEPEPEPVKEPPQQAKPQNRVNDIISQLDDSIDEPLGSGQKEPEAEPVKPAPAVRKVTAGEAAASAAQVAEEIARSQKEQKPQYCFPPIDLLKQPGRSVADGTAEMKKNSARLNETLASFKIDAHIINVTRGPSVTRYEVELDKGVRLNKLTTSADDIALNLGVSSVRIAPVPGKISVVGIEVPNQIVTNVRLREVIDSPEFRRSASKSTFAVGKDIGGSCIVGNIAKMPHMLIAGTTGSGKSVCMNSIIISLLYKASPEDVKLIMVDPKMVELGIYNDIPHLLIPVVTDPKKAAGSLQWAVTEMMRRYKLMSDAGVRDLESFNAECEEEEGKLPQVVIIIDELADLMLVAAKEVEDSICRIAQMGRAAGMHLIIATQRPSADVITGLMKANIPSRIAFSVASAMESRIILDTQGAEKLVGKGDMLFAPIGTGKPQRVQGCFVSDGEVEAVATFVKDHYKASYDEGVMDEIEKTVIHTDKKSAPAQEPEANREEMEHDDMLVPAVDVIMETGQASVSMLQRRLKLGYARAARIVDELEELGVVGPFQGSKPRAIQITKDQWEELKAAGWPNEKKDSLEEP